MYTIQKPKREPSLLSGPLVFHIRRLRQWYGRNGINQNDFAVLSGVSPRALRYYEAARRLPPPLYAVLAFSAALNVPLEELFDPRLVKEVQSAVDARRTRLDLRIRPVGDARDACR